MTPSSPTLEGFRIMFRRPVFGLAEIAWRWSFGCAAALLLAFSFLEYLDTLQVSGRDLFLLRTRQPALISQAIAHILGGSALRVVETMMVLALALAAGWIVIAALARAATIEALLDHVREQSAVSGFHREQKQPRDWSLRSLLVLNCFRVGVALVAVGGSLAAFILGRAASPAENPSPGAAFLIFLGVTSLVWMAWSGLNWVLSLAPIFVVADGRNTFGAISAIVDLCRSRAGSVLAAGTWFGLAHIAAFFVATSVVAFPLGLSGMLPAGVTLGGVLLVTLLYFAAADFLYVGRLAAYVAMVELPESAAAESSNPVPPDRAQPVAVSIQPPSAIDPDELILSDLPAPG
jgi:hypothetical protein